MSNSRTLSSMKFRFTDDYIGSSKFTNATFDAFSLATLMYNRPDDLLKQIRKGMKVLDVDMNKTIDMDNNTFDALLAYGNELCSKQEDNSTPEQTSLLNSFSQLDGSEQNGNVPTQLQQHLFQEFINFDDYEKISNSEAATHFETMCGIVREFQHQVSWGPIGKDEQLTKELRDAYYHHMDKGVYDYFWEKFHPHGDSRDYYFQLRNNLSPAQINDLHQFVIDFSGILLSYIDIQDVRWYIKFSNRYHADQTNPKFKGDKIGDIFPTLESMFELSTKALQNKNGFTPLQASLLNSHTTFFSKITTSNWFGFDENVSQLDDSNLGGNDLAPLQKSLINGMKGF